MPSTQPYVLYKSTDTPVALLSTMLEGGTRNPRFVGNARAYLELVDDVFCDGRSASRLRDAFLEANEAGWFSDELAEKVDDMCEDLLKVPALKVRPPTPNLTAPRVYILDHNHKP
jgi:hypothetical protein